MGMHMNTVGTRGLWFGGDGVDMGLVPRSTSTLVVCHVMHGRSCVDRPVRGGRYTIAAQPFGVEIPTPSIGLVMCPRTRVRLREETDEEKKRNNKTT